MTDSREMREGAGQSRKGWWHAPALAVLWALIFLPALGVPEYKGEEPRRVQPALAMLGSGEWIVPHIGGEPYYNKPPLINWLVAMAFRIGGQSETSARMVSALAVLVMMLGIYSASRGWMGAERAFAAAIMAATHVSMLDKGRLIEIEPLYISLYSLALVFWLGAFLRPRPGGREAAGWELWLLPWFFLGLGLLVKGPVHLLFFYSVVVAVALCAGQWRRLFSVWHGAGILLGAAIFLAWALPLFQRIPGGAAVKTWRGQMASRIAGEPDRLESFEFLLNLPKALGNFLPWTVLLIAALVLLRRPGERAGRPPVAGTAALPDGVARGMLYGFLPLFVALGLVPGILPRYTMPLFTPAAIWLALALPEEGGRVAAGWAGLNRGLAVVVIVCGAAAVFLHEGAAGWVYAALAILCGLAASRVSGARGGGGWDALSAGTACALAGGALVYAAAVAPRMTERDDVRPVAREILARTENGRGLCLVDPESRPFIAYLPPGVRFARRPEGVPPGTRYVIVKRSVLDKLPASERERLGDLWEFRDRGRERFALAKLKAPLSGAE